MENPNPKPLLRTALEVLTERPLALIAAGLAGGLLWLLWYVLDALLRTGRVGG